MTRTGSANDTHETVAVCGDACFRSAMALDHAGLSNGIRRGSADGVLLAKGRVRLLVSERGETPESAKSEPSQEEKES